MDAGRDAAGPLGARTPRHWFGKPVAPGKEPRKVNVFEHVMTHQGVLEQAPMFPFFGAAPV